MKLSCFTQNVLLSYETSLPFAQNTVSSRVYSKCCSQRTQNCPLRLKFPPQVKIAALPDAVHPLGSLIIQDTFQVLRASVDS